MPKKRVCATDTGLPKITRRSFGLAAASTSLAALPVAGFATTYSDDDPILQIYSRWLKAHNEWIRLASMPGNEDWDWPESIAADKAEYAALDQLKDTVPRSVEGIAALAHVLWVYEGPGSIAGTQDFHDECKLTGNKLMLAIWRGAGACTGLPLK